MDYADQSAGRRTSAGNKTVNIGAIVVACVIVLVIAIGPVFFRSLTIASAAMAPTLIKGDHVIASSLAYGAGRSPQRGDLIVFRPPGRAASYIKRVIGLPGDRIQLKDGLVYINGGAVQREKLAPINETGPFGNSHPVQRFQETLPNGRSYVTHSYGPDGDVENTGVYEVPAGQFFVLCDNRDDALDSRYPEAMGGGDVRSQDLRGKAVLVVALGRQASDAQPRRLVQFIK